jgi:hypothetical protein
VKQDAMRVCRLVAGRPVSCDAIECLDEGTGLGVRCETEARVFSKVELVQVEYYNSGGN